MTTLPQNPALRLPRPSPAAAPGGAPIDSGMTGTDVLRVLRANAPLLALLVAVSGVVGWRVNSYLAAHASRYTARGLCEVKMPAEADLLNSQRGSLAGDILIEQRTQVQNLRNESLYSRLLQNESSPIRNTTWFKSMNGDPKLLRQSLSKNFSAAPIPDTRLVTAEFQYSNPEDARIIVTEVVGQHYADEMAQQSDQAFLIAGQLSIYKTRYENDLRNVQADMKSLAEDITRKGLSPNLGSGNTTPPALVRVDAATRKLSEASDALAGIKLEADNFTKAMANNEPYPKLLKQIEQDPEVAHLTQNTRELEQALATETTQGVNSPSVVNLRNRLEASKKSLKEMKDQKYIENKQEYLEGLKSAQLEVQGRVDSYKKELTEATAEVNGGASLIQRYRALEEKERTANINLAGVNATIDRNQQGGFKQPILQWVSGGQPITPDVPSFPNLPVTLSLAITIGLTLGLAIAFTRELMDSSIRSPRDVAKVGPIPVLGQISHEDDDPQAAGSRLPLLIADAPHSMTAEQLRQLRTRLQQASSLDTTRSLMITSPNPGDGKTTIAANLAAGLALVGRRILFVDANFRRPELHKLFGLDNSQGFATALAAPEQVASLAKATKIPNLFVLPAGPKLANATEILEGANLHEFIEKALETYDHVIFDSGPILFASETVAMAPRVDGVVTVVRARQSTRGVLGRVRETLRQLKAESLGVVLNGVRSHGGGYYSRNMKTFYEYAGNGQP